MLKTQIKASQIGNLTDARYFAAWQVEWLGFSLDTASESYLTPTQVQALKAWVEGPKMVGEFGLQSLEEIATAANLLELDLVQISPFISAKEASEKIDVPIIKRLIPDPQNPSYYLYEQLKTEQVYVEAFLLNLDSAGISWSMLQRHQGFTIAEIKSWCQEFPIILSLDFPAEKVNEILDQIQPLGLNLIGGEEEKVGLKSFDDLDAIFELLEDLE
ncbi:MAG: N-(5'-phosphoribosyl)anthranilate isomerase [Bacteroidota bacterium]